MRKVSITIAASCLAASLAGCASTPAILAGTLPTAAEIQADTLTACAFLPTAATIASILTAQSQSASANTVTGATIAASICAAVAPAKTASRGTRKVIVPRGLQLPTVNGVVIEGYFVS